MMEPRSGDSLALWMDQHLNTATAMPDCQQSPTISTSVLNIFQTRHQVRDTPQASHNTGNESPDTIQ